MEQKKRTAKEEESAESVKRIKKDSKKIPNIAQELAKNRKNVKGTSPSPGIQLSMSPSALISSFKNETDTDADEVPPQGASGAVKMEQLKISSLLSPTADVGREVLASNTPKVAQSPLQQPRQSSVPPKVILPTQKLGERAFAKNESPDSPGVLVARISSPVNSPIELALGLPGKKALVAPVTSSSGKVAEKAKKQNSNASTMSKSKGGAKASNDAKKASRVTKKESSTSTASKTGSEKSNAKSQPEKDNGAKKSTDKSGEKKEGKKTTGKVTDKKEGNTSAKASDSKKKTAAKKEQASSTKVKTPKKLVAAPAIKSPSLLEVFERNKVTKETEDPTIVLDIPLYSSKSNEYLDENGQVSFNFYKLVHDKFQTTQKESTLTDVKVAKRNLLSQLNTTNGSVGTVEDEEGEDLVEVDDDGDEDEEEDGDEEKAIASPKKKSHPNKGKSLIGKYDTEDPFIDDTELLWEEQRAATKDGFFVYFGPLIEKGHYASLERADGTMKRGGVKNK